MTPRVSVVMPAYNAASFITEAVGSTLAQTFTDFELIVVDDGSTDDTATIARAFADDRLRVIGNSANLGMFTSLNIALGSARGEFIARMDADDIMAPTRLAEQVALMDDRPDIVVCGSDMRLFGESDEATDLPADDAEIKAHFL